MPIDESPVVSTKIVLSFAIIDTICTAIVFFLTICNISDYRKSQDIKTQFGSFVPWYCVFTLIIAIDWIAGGWYQYVINEKSSPTVLLCMGLGIIEAICGTLAGFYEEGLFYYTYKNLKAKTTGVHQNIGPNWVLELILKAIAIQTILLIILGEFLNRESSYNCWWIWTPGFQSMQMVLQVVLNGSFVTLNTYLYMDLKKALQIADVEQQVKTNVKHFCNYVIAVSCTIILIGICRVIAATITYWNLCAAITAVVHTSLVLIQALCVSFMRQGEPDFGYTRRKIAEKVSFWKRIRLGKRKRRDKLRVPLKGGEEAIGDITDSHQANNLEVK
jgi:hypothetical protein